MTGDSQRLCKSRFSFFPTRKIQIRTHYRSRLTFTVVGVGFIFAGLFPQLPKSCDLWQETELTDHTGKVQEFWCFCPEVSCGFYSRVPWPSCSFQLGRSVLAHHKWLLTNLHQKYSLRQRLANPAGPWLSNKKHEQKRRTIKQQLRGKHVKKQQNQDNKKKDKRVKDEKRDSSFEEDWKGCGQETFRSLLYSSFYSFVKQGQPHLLIHWNNTRINSPSVQYFQSSTQKHQ